ncbi:MAG: hypothetical protein Tsb0014_08120 [Pleurocapsa sp.]
MKNFLTLGERVYLLTISTIILILGNALPLKAHSKTIFYLAQTSPDLPDTPLPGKVTPSQPEVTPLPPIEDFLESPPSQIPDTVTPDSTVSFEVRRFRIKNNTVFKPEELQPILDEYLNRSLTYADLLEIETKLTKLYLERGYINSGVVIPAPQNISDGEIVIQAVEGTVEDITVNVRGRLKENYVRSRLRRGTKKLLNISELQKALQLLQLDPLVENLNAELSVGSSRDRWLLSVDVNQAQAFRPLLFINNSRTPSVGSFQRGIELTHESLLGLGDRASVIYKNTNGSNDLNVSYAIPYNALNGTVGLGYRYVKSDIIEEPFDELDIESETSEYKLTVRQPIIVSASANSTQELAVGAEFSRQNNSTTFIVNGDNVRLSPGANDDGETKISALRFFQDWTRRSRKDVLAARSQFSLGLDLFDATVNVGEPDSKFFAWRGQVQWLRQLQASSNINLLLRSDIQLSTSDLVPLERFSLGGLESVRGYRQDALLGDSGVFLSGEVRIPFYRWNSEESNLSVIPFVDFGTTWSNSENPNQEEDTVVSTGLGLQLSLEDTLRARLDYGIPLIDVEDSDDTLQEKGIYFSVEYSPF